MKPKDSLPSSQEPDESSPQPHIHFSKIQSTSNLMCISCCLGHSKEAVHGQGPVLQW